MKNFKWYEWAMLVVLTVMLLGGASLSPWGQRFFLRDEAPAWTQAVGAILAVAGTAWAAIWSVRRSEQRARDDSSRQDVALIRSCVLIAKEAHSAHARTAAKMNGRAGGVHPQTIESARLRSVDASALAMLTKGAPAEALECLLIVRRELAMTIEDIEEINLRPNVRNEFRDAAERQADKRTMAAELAYLRLEKIARSASDAA